MSYFDTHCHLNFKAFEGGSSKIIKRAVDADVKYFVIPGTDLRTSASAIDIAKNNENTYAAVGIHPHHIHEFQFETFTETKSNALKSLTEMAYTPKVVAIGEVGLDRHTYYASRHGDGIEISEAVFEMQKELFVDQIIIAANLKKSLIVHNREAKRDLINVVEANQDLILELKGKVVLHCCESDFELLDLAMKYGFYIGVDGDVTYDVAKQEFARHIPLNMLVLETDSPYILPEPLKSAKKYPNMPSNIPIIAECISKLRNVEISEIQVATNQNAQNLFGLSH
ncbi:MAG: TatD family hydrolase [Patescibacteria group bacterium]